MSQLRGSGRWMIALIFLALPATGWCPPPPEYFSPQSVALNFGTVEVGDRTARQIDFVPSPFWTHFAPFTIPDDPYNFGLSNSNHFEVDMDASTCVPGAVVDWMHGCSLVLEFHPRATGELELFLALLVCSRHQPQCVNIGLASHISGVGIGAPSAVNSTSAVGLGWLAFGVALIALLVISRKG